MNYKYILLVLIAAFTFANRSNAMDDTYLTATFEKHKNKLCRTVGIEADLSVYLVRKLITTRLQKVERYLCKYKNLSRITPFTICKNKQYKKEKKYLQKWLAFFSSSRELHINVELLQRSS